MVLLEDSGALVGLLLALGGVGLTMATDNPVWDGVGTLCIGVLLGIIAVILIIEMQSLLIGEGVTATEERRIVECLNSDVIAGVIHLETQSLGPDEILVAAKIAMVPGLDIAAVAAGIDEAEARIRGALPAARVIYLEPDLYRSRS